MKNKWIISLALGGLMLSPPLLATSVMTKTETVTRVQPNVTLREITFHGSDPLSIDDPLGNSPVTARHDAGPALTQRLSYSEDCREDACIRAFKRWESSTTWRQDRAMGL